MQKNIDSIGEKPNQYKEDKKFLAEKRAPKNFAQELKKLKYLPHVPKILSAHERLVIKFLIGIIALSVLVLGSKFYLDHTTVVAKYGGTYTEGMVGEPTYINPILADANEIDKSISSFLFRGLMKFDKNLQLQPDIAQSYEKSDDGKQYIFHLKRDVKWHDFNNQQGIDKVVSADDVVFTIQSIQNKEYNSPLRANFNGVVVEKVDDFTVKFTLDDPFSPFLDNTTVGIVPKHIWENITPTNIGLAEVNLKPIGSGPYKFKSLEKDKRGTLQAINLDRFKDFSGKRPYIDGVTFRFYQDTDQVSNAYEKKDINGINFLLPDQTKAIAAKRSINVLPLDLSLYHAIFFNFTDNKQLQDKNVRTALSYAVDRKRIISEALNGQGIEAYGPILPGFIGFNDKLTKIPFDSAKAESILDQAGWRDTNHNDIRDKDGQELEFTLRTTTFPEHEKTAQILQEEWKKIGVKLNVEKIDSNVLQQQYIRPRDYTMLLFGEIVGHDPDPYVFWHSSQRKDPGLNLTSFKNQSVDNLLDEARKTADPAQRIQKYVNFQNIIADEVPAIFLYTPTYLYGLNGGVRGVDIKTITTPSERFLGFEDWYVKTSRVWKK